MRDPEFERFMEGVRRKMAAYPKPGTPEYRRLERQAAAAMEEVARRGADAILAEGEAEAGDVEPMEKAARPKHSTDDLEHPMDRLKDREHGEHTEAHLQEFVELRRKLHSTDDPEEQQQIAARMQALSVHRGKHVIARHQARTAPPKGEAQKPKPKKRSR